MPIEDDEVPLPKGYSLLPGTWVSRKTSPGDQGTSPVIGRVQDVNWDYFNPKRVMLDVVLFGQDGRPVQLAGTNGLRHDLVERGSIDSLWQAIDQPNFENACPSITS